MWSRCSVVGALLLLAFSSDLSVCQEMPKQEEWRHLNAFEFKKLLKPPDKKKLSKKQLAVMTAEMKYKKYTRLFRKQQQRKLWITMKDYGNEIVQMEGGTIVLSCLAVDEHQMPSSKHLEFRKCAQMLESGTYDKKRISINDEGQLKISPTLPLDSCRYTCHRNEVYVGETTLTILSTEDAVADGLKHMVLIWLTGFPAYVIFVVIKYKYFPPEEVESEEDYIFGEEVAVSSKERVNRMKMIVNQTVQVLGPRPELEGEEEEEEEEAEEEEETEEEDEEADEEEEDEENERI